MLMQWYHTCGYPLPVETKNYGQQHHFTKFYDGHIETFSQRLRNCPTCQKPLGSLDLMPHSMHFEQPVKKMA